MINKECNNKSFAIFKWSLMPNQDTTLWSHENLPCNDRQTRFRLKIAELNYFPRDFMKKFHPLAKSPPQLHFLGFGFPFKSRSLPECLVKNTEKRFSSAAWKLPGELLSNSITYIDKERIFLFLRLNLQLPIQKRCICRGRHFREKAKQ